MANPEHLDLLKQGVKEWNDRIHIREGSTGLVEADLSGADLRELVLFGANLRGANLANSMAAGVLAEEADFSDANLAGMDLSGAILMDATMTAANLSGANLTGAHLTNGDLFDVDLSCANLTGATLFDADLRHADMRDANLVGAILANANLSCADLSEADVHESYMANTILAGIDLRRVKGLTTVKHRAPSIIGIDTIYLSHGLIPESFLRGAGVPDGLISYIPSLVGAEDGVQFYSCFISYSHQDEQFCKRLYSRLRDEHLRVWFAPEDIEGGKKLYDQIETQIRVFDRLLLVLSRHSMQSEWVATEIHHARQREKSEDRQVLFPISLCSYDDIKAWKSFDAESGKDMAREIREYFIPDFSNWKDHETFEGAFSRLLRDLRHEQTDS